MKKYIFLMTFITISVVFFGFTTNPGFATTPGYTYNPEFNATIVNGAAHGYFSTTAVNVYFYCTLNTVPNTDIRFSAKNLADNTESYVLVYPVAGQKSYTGIIYLPTGDYLVSMQCGSSAQGYTGLFGVEGN